MARHDIARPGCLVPGQMPDPYRDEQITGTIIRRADGFDEHSRAIIIIAGVG